MSKYISRISTICIIIVCLISMKSVAENRVINQVETLTDHSVKVNLKWLKDGMENNIRVTSWTFQDADTLIVNYQSDETTRIGWSERIINNNNHMFPMKIYLQEDNKETQSLVDIKSTDTAYGAIMNLYYRGVISGYLDGTFRENNSVSRAEFAKMLLLTAKYEISEEPISFTDIKTHWSKEYISTLAGKGILKGKGNNIFDPEGTITIGEVLTVISRTFNLYGNGYDYTDALETHWSNEYFLNLVEEGFIKPSNSYYYPYTPNKAATREDCAILLSSVIEQLHGVTP